LAEHLRRSLMLRSLNFFHGVPHGSSITAGAAVLYEPILSAAAWHRATHASSCRGHFHFVLIGFFGAPGRRGQQPSRTQIDLKPGCTQWKNSAQFRSRAASPISICRDRYNFATNFWPASLVFTAINEVSRYPCAGPSRKGRGNHRGLHLPKS
jgi:hypothetical protein